MNDDALAGASSESGRGALEASSAPTNAKALDTGGRRAARFEEVLTQELAAINARRDMLGVQHGKLDHHRPPDSLGAAWNARLLGVCFSGGGIRSATFNLGIVQALAGFGLLRHVDYVSTVSGGGYIGAWLTALGQRRFACAAPKGSAPTAGWVAGALQSLAGKVRHAGTAHPMPPPAAERFDKHAYRRFEEALAQSAGRQANRADREHQAIRYLRELSNYLTPKLGIFSGDTWALFSIYLRNALLNQLVLVFALLALLLAPRWLSWSLQWIGPPQEPWHWVAWALFVASGFMIVSWHLGRNLAGMADKDPGEPNALASPGVIALVLLPVLVIGISMPLWLPEVTARLAGLTPDLAWMAWARAALIGAVLTLAAWLCAWLAAYVSPWWQESEAAFWRSMLTYAAHSGVIFGICMHMSSRLLAGIEYPGYALIVAPPLLAVGILTAGVLHVGLAGKMFSSHYSEWLSRLGGLMLIGTVAWIAVTGLVFLGPLVVAALGHYYLNVVLGSGWVLTTLGAVLLGGARLDPSTSRSRRVFLAIAPWVFIVGLFLILSAALQWILARIAIGVPAWQSDVAAASDAFSAHFTSTAIALPGLFAEYGSWLQATERAWLLLGASVAVIVLAWLFSRRVDINTFSLNSMYGNRLVRCYLGASVQDRWANRFSGLSAQDDLSLHASPMLVGDRPLLVHADSEGRLPAHATADPAAAAAYPGPYPLINTAINLVTGSSLAWQERKAGAFLLSPLYCGYHWESPSDDPDTVDAYRMSAQFSSRPKRLTLGEAMATSGAAASPSMGHHTTAPFAFLLGIFNIRLGRWMGNPAVDDDVWRKSGPDFALWHLLREVFGLANSKSSFVYVSDGGHFENLGLYELVRRQCRYIIVCDSGADPGYEFEDLGNAIRKCRIDLGVEIDLDVRQIAERDARGQNGAPCAVGSIRYGRDQSGTILYIKACRRPGLPSDVMHYGTENLAFPHETTADQFFSESQFESYRRLGHFLANEVIGSAVAEGGGTIDDVDRLFRELRQIWHAPSTSVAANFTRLAAQVDDLFERLRTSPRLAFLSKQFYPEWGSLVSQAGQQEARAQAIDMCSIPHDEDELREGFYFCNSLIQLMESVYLDLQLEVDRAHPDNSGWMNLFHHWSWSGMFRATWAVCAASYGRRFRTFCERELKLDLGRVETVPVLGHPGGEALEKSIEVSPLNMLERKQVSRLLHEVGTAGVRVHGLTLKVENPLAEASGNDLHLRTFNIGYAVLRENELLMYRIQDHLRNMGLGRRGLRALVALDKGVGGRELTLTEHAPAWLALVGETPVASRLADFRAMIASVNEERADELGRGVRLRETSARQAFE